MKNVQFLLVEDNAGDVALFKEALLEAGVPVDLRVLSNGEEASDDLLQAIRRGGLPDAIFLDLNLPRRSGVEVLFAVKSLPEFRCVPVIVVTSTINPRELEKAYQAGANCVITKPFELKSYLDTMSLAIRFWHAAAASNRPQP